MTDTNSPNVHLVERVYAAFREGDIDAVVGAMHPHIAWHEAEHSPWHAPDGYHGPTDVLVNVFARIPEIFDDFEVVPKTVHDAGTTVVVEGRYQAATVTTRDRLDAQVCHVWTIGEGKLASFRQYTDTWQFARMTGTASP